MAKRKTLPDLGLVFQTAQAHLSEVGARDFSVSDIEEQANLEAGLLAPVFVDLESFAASFGRFIDGTVAQEMAGELGPSDDEARDRLFEVLMLRFDALQEYRATVRILARQARKDPRLGQVFFRALPRSMELMLSLAHIETARAKRPFQVAGLAALWLRCVRVWLKDETEDMAKTMAAVDKSLKDAHGIARRLF